MDYDQHKQTGAFFGRRKGHPLRAHQARLFGTLLPKLKLDLSKPAPNDLRALFDNADDVRVDLTDHLVGRLVPAVLDVVHEYVELHRSADVGLFGRRVGIRLLTPTGAGCQCEGRDQRRHDTQEPALIRPSHCRSVRTECGSAGGRWGI